MMEKRKADHLDIPGEFRLHRIIDLGKKEIIGTAAVTHFNGAAILWNIFVDPGKRRKYYGTSLITALQAIYRRITTSHYSDAGESLCKSCGFTAETGPHTNISQLVWVKGVNKGGKK
jgi:hypothetical protein